MADPHKYNVWRVQSVHHHDERRAIAIDAANHRAAALAFLVRAIALEAIALKELPLDVSVRDIAGAAKRFRAVSPTELRALRTCKVCACTNDDACAGGCSWIALDRCSSCEAATARAS